MKWFRKGYIHFYCMYPYGKIYSPPKNKKGTVCCSFKYLGKLALESFFHNMELVHTKRRRCFCIASIMGSAQINIIQSFVSMFLINSLESCRLHIFIRKYIDKFITQHLSEPSSLIISFGLINQFILTEFIIFSKLFKIARKV